MMILSWRRIVVLTALASGACGSSAKAVGGSADGGTGGAGGAAACANGGVTFRMIGGGKPGSLGFCVAKCNVAWLTIKKDTGEMVGSVTSSCTTTCSECVPVACDEGRCAPPLPIDPQGERFDWGGKLWTPATCGANVACVNSQCPDAPTHLVATMCGYPRVASDAGSCAYDPTPKCVDVAFDYPTANEVVGVLDPTR
jgi:hypothetical protein